MADDTDCVGLLWAADVMTDVSQAAKAARDALVLQAGQGVAVTVGRQLAKATAQDAEEWAMVRTGRPVSASSAPRIGDEGVGATPQIDGIANSAASPTVLTSIRCSAVGARRMGALEARVPRNSGCVRNTKIIRVTKRRP